MYELNTVEIKTVLADRDTMRKQADSLRAEYDRLSSEYQKIQVTAKNKRTMMLFVF